MPENDNMSRMLQSKIVRSQLKAANQVLLFFSFSFSVLLHTFTQDKLSTRAVLSIYYTMHVNKRIREEAKTLRA